MKHTVQIPVTGYAIIQFVSEDTSREDLEHRAETIFEDFVDDGDLQGSQVALELELSQTYITTSNTDAAIC